jgi:hypothetical protein
MERLASVVAEAELALADFAEDTPSLRELRGIGDVVHDFYTGAERVFETIAPELNGGIPAGPAWHRELLESMTLDLPSIRPPVITRATAGKLAEFLRFRHLFRNLYGFELEWPRLQALVARLPDAWRALDADLRRFLGFLDAAASSS